MTTLVNYYLVVNRKPYSNHLFSKIESVLLTTSSYRNINCIPLLVVSGLIPSYTHLHFGCDLSRVYRVQTGYGFSRSLTWFYMQRRQCSSLEIVFIFPNQDLPSNAGGCEAATFWLLGSALVAARKLQQQSGAGMGPQQGWAGK